MPLTIGTILMAVSAVNCATAFFVIPQDAFRIVLASAIGLVAGLLTVRGIRLWQIAIVIGSAAYLWLASRPLLAIVLEGEFRLLVSVFWDPLHSPNISTPVKVTYVWFHGIVPLLLCIMAVLAVVALFYPHRNTDIKANAV